MQSVLKLISEKSLDCWSAASIITLFTFDHVWHLFTTSSHESHSALAQDEKARMYTSTYALDFKNSSNMVAEPGASQIVGAVIPLVMVEIIEAVRRIPHDASDCASWKKPSRMSKKLIKDSQRKRGQPHTQGLPC